MNESAITPEKARAIIEAILLTAEDPVSPGRLVSLLDGFNGRDIREAIDALKGQYEQAGHGITIIEVANGFQLATRQELSPWIRKFHKEKSQIRLSQAALESLSIIAFKQPITRVEVDSIRGVNSAGVLQTLMELNMVRIVGRSDGIGKPMLFGTTREFLIHFGLKSLTDLPKPRELEELLATGEQKAKDRDQLALGLQEEEEEGQPSSEDGEAVPDAESAPEEESAEDPDSAEIVESDEPDSEVDEAADSGDNEDDLDFEDDPEDASEESDNLDEEPVDEEDDEDEDEDPDIDPEDPDGELEEDDDLDEEPEDEEEGPDIDDEDPQDEEPDPDKTDADSQRGN